MIKMAPKTQKNRNTKEKRSDSIFFVNEFITAPLYKRTLYDRTPVISGVESNEKNNASFRSKFLHNFKTVSEFTGGKKDCSIGSGYSKLKGVKGIEKLFANMYAWGECDIHAGNTGIMKIKNEQGRNEFVFAKIDHGWSASQFFTTPEKLLRNFAYVYKGYGYGNSVPLNVDMLKQSIDQITEIKPEEIEKIVKSRTFQLKEMGFDIKNLRFPFRKDCKFYKLALSFNKSFDSFEELEKRYIYDFINQMYVMEKLSENLDIISKIDIKGYFPGAQTTWKNGEWLQAIKGENPIKWAVDNNKTIAGKDPIIWAIDNNEEIDGDDPIEWAKDNNKTIEGKDPIVWAIDNNEEIDEDDPIVWAIDNNEEIDGDDPIEWAKDNNKTIEGKDPIVWAIDNNEEIDRDDPIEWAKDNDKKIDGLDPNEYEKKQNLSIKPH